MDRWDAFLVRWAKKTGMPDAYHRWGLWRWRVLPPKMREICRDRGIALNDDFTLRAVTGRGESGCGSDEDGTIP